MSKPIEAFVNAYTYWSGKYTASRHVIDLQKKTSAFKQLMEEINNQGISKHHLELLIEKSQKVTSLSKDR